MIIKDQQVKENSNKALVADVSTDVHQLLGINGTSVVTCSSDEKAKSYK